MRIGWRSDAGMLSSGADGLSEVPELGSSMLQVRKVSSRNNSKRFSAGNFASVLSVIEKLR